MRRFLNLSVLGALILSSGAAAQQASNESQPTRTAYFLIDSSYSMKGKQQAAEELVRIKRDEFLAENPVGRLSRTYFGGDNGGKCWSSVSINSPKEVDQPPSILPLANRNTQLGAALTAAIQATGDTSAHIYIFSDGGMTPGCGVDVCVIAQSLLPKPGVSVEFVPVLASPEDQDRLGCIDAAQHNRGKSYDTRESTETSGTQSSLAANDPGQEQPAEYGFLERWLWLIGFLCVSFAAALLGTHFTKKLVEWESRTKEVQSLRSAVLLEDSEVARAKLAKIIKDGEGTGGRKKLEADVPQSKRSFALLVLLPATLFVFGITIIGFLTFGPDGFEFSGFELGVAKSLAWTVLDSDFSTAFAAVWIALLYYVATQYRRLDEAQHGYSIATEEATRTRDAKKERARQALISAYEGAIAALDDLEFQEPWSTQTRTRAGNITSGDVGNWEQAISKAKEIAKGPEVIPSEARDEELTERLKYLSRITPRSSFFGKPDFGRFVSKLDRENLLRDSEISEWKTLAEALSFGSNLRIKSSLRHLVAKWENPTNDD